MTNQADDIYEAGKRIMKERHNALKEKSKPLKDLVVSEIFEVLMVNQYTENMIVSHFDYHTPIGAIPTSEAGCKSKIIIKVKPLSKDPITFTRFPFTAVKVESNTLECEFPITSLETISSSVYSRIPFNSFSEAFLNDLLTFSTFAFFSTSATTSMIDPHGTGTLIATPLNLPFISGNTFSTASSAPVVVGTMFSPAVLPLLLFMLLPSTKD